MSGDLGVPRGERRFTVSGAGKNLPSFGRWRAHTYRHRVVRSAIQRNVCYGGVDRPDTKGVCRRLFTHVDKAHHGKCLLVPGIEGEAWRAVLSRSR